MLDDFSTFMRLERALSENTIVSYCSDLKLFFSFIASPAGYGSLLPPLQHPSMADEKYLSAFLDIEFHKGLSKRSQARQISSIKAFYRYMESRRNPCERIETPKLSRYLPTVLSVEEILSIFDSMDLSTYEGLRNRAMLEMLSFSSLSRELMRLSRS